MEHHKWFTNKKCQYYPCHDMGAEDVFFNCLFCFCPLYVLGESCGGDYYYSEKGIKNCSSCSLPHNSKGYDFVMSRIRDVIVIAEKKK